MFAIFESKIWLELTKISHSDHTSRLCFQKKGESSTLALIKRRGFFEQQCTCTVWSVELGTRNLRVNGDQVIRWVCGPIISRRMAPPHGGLKKATRSKKSSSFSKIASVPFLVHLLFFWGTWLFWTGCLFWVHHGGAPSFVLLSAHALIWWLDHHCLEDSLFQELHSSHCMYIVIQRNHDAWLRPRSNFHLFFWKHSPRGVVRVTYLRQFKSDFRFENWNMRVDKFLIDFS